jgi:hypothetical protein
MGDSQADATAFSFRPWGLNRRAVNGGRTIDRATSEFLSVFWPTAAAGFLAVALAVRTSTVGRAFLPGLAVTLLLAVPLGVLAGALAPAQTANGSFLALPNWLLYALAQVVLSPIAGFAAGMIGAAMVRRRPPHSEGAGPAAYAVALPLIGCVLLGYFCLVRWTFSPPKGYYEMPTKAPAPMRAR